MAVLQELPATAELLRRSERKYGGFQLGMPWHCSAGNGEESAEAFWSAPYPVARTFASCTASPVTLEPATAT